MLLYGSSQYPHASCIVCLSVCLSVCCHSCSERRAAHYTKVYRRFLKPPSKAIARKDLVPALREVHFGTVDEEQIIEVLQVREGGAPCAHVPHSPSLHIYGGTECAGCVVRCLAYRCECLNEILFLCDVLGMYLSEYVDSATTVFSVYIL